MRLVVDAFASNYQAVADRGLLVLDSPLPSLLLDRAWHLIWLTFHSTHHNDELFVSDQAHQIVSFVPSNLGQLHFALLKVRSAFLTH